MSLIGCMLEPSQCDPYTQYIGNSASALSFRESYIPYQEQAQPSASTDGQQTTQATSYLTRPPPLTPRILLLHAESQIGKTDACLALLSKLKAAMRTA